MTFGESCRNSTLPRVTVSQGGRHWPRWLFFSMGSSGFLKVDLEAQIVKQMCSELLWIWGGLFETPSCSPLIPNLWPRKNCKVAVYSLNSYWAPTGGEHCLTCSGQGREQHSLPSSDCRTLVSRTAGHWSLRMALPGARISGKTRDKQREACSWSPTPLLCLSQFLCCYFFVYPTHLDETRSWVRDWGQTLFSFQTFVSSFVGRRVEL